MIFGDSVLEIYLIISCFIINLLYLVYFSLNILLIMNGHHESKDNILLYHILKTYYQSIYHINLIIE